MSLLKAIVAVATLCLSAVSLAATKKVVLISIDGLPALYFQDKLTTPLMPNLLELARRGSLFLPVLSVNPTVTFPAHTSMVTGVLPAVHGINGNHPFEPLREGAVDWNWYSEDIRVKTVWDFAFEKGKSVASLYWPVTVGANIRWNVPQFYYRRSKEDVKMLRVISSGGIYQMLEKRLKISLQEQSSDGERLKAASFTVHHYAPHLTLVYTTELDTIQHRDGPFSENALKTLNEIDTALGKFLNEIRLYKRKDITLIVTSDHGFHQYRAACQPNVWLKKEGYLNANFIFRTHGGIAWLWSANSAAFKLPDKISSELPLACPGTALLSSGVEFEKLRRETENQALAFLISTGDTILLPTWQGDIVYREGQTFFSHGLLAHEPSMATVALVYPPLKKGQKIEKLTDIFSLICRELRLACRPGEKRLGS